MNHQFILSVTVAFLLSLVGCAVPNQPKDLLLKNFEIMLMVDGSPSSNTPEFQLVLKSLCKSLGSSLQKGDFINKMVISGSKPDYTSPVAVSPLWIKDNCAKRAINPSYGTLTAPAFNIYLQSLKSSQSDPKRTPVMIFVVQANEGENPDPTELWHETAKQIASLGGYMVIVGVTNSAGAENLNSKLYSATAAYRSNVLFTSDSEKDINSKIRTALKR